MHELPQDLANSVRSCRASVSSSHNPRKVPSDLEKGRDQGDYEEKRFERAPSPTSSSIHPNGSRQALHQLRHHGAYDELLDTEQAPHGNIPSAPSRRDGKASQHAPAAGEKNVVETAPRVEDPDPAANRLDENTTPLTTADFYELMGMRPPVSKQQNPNELAVRHGLYGRIRSRLSYTQIKYRIFDILTYAFLGLQLVLSATFIVLGSLTKVDSHIAIAVLGAVSTVVAGALALMKGQGLPNRLRQTRDGLRNVVFEAEELYWDVGAERPVYYRDVKKVREAFLRVIEEDRRNHPDTWNAIAMGAAEGVKPSGAGRKPMLAVSAARKS
ncbi:hypothetical protein LTR53_016439 [Teratosphaeriaceae sp. CCFEE 6253]|nr:hypothetical protein LTR53_016439 [Teratosphaeriaceae sp. CCFEE 6253]